MLQPLLKRSTPPRSPRGPPKPSPASVAEGLARHEATRLALAHAAAIAAQALESPSSPIGAPATFAPESIAGVDSDMTANPTPSIAYSFLGLDPLLQENTTRISQLEESLRAAESHARMVEERAAEIEEKLFYLDNAHRNSQAETAELERRLRSESSARLRKECETRTHSAAV